MATAKGKLGIWVIEGEWSSRVTDVRSVRPVLESLSDAGAAKHVRSHVNDPEDVLRAFKRWAQAQHSAYGVGYVALHGATGTVFTRRKAIDLFELGDQLRSDLPPKALASKVLHFGSCSVLQMDDAECDELRAALGVKAITGFTKDVDWFPSLAFELLLLDALGRYSRASDAARYLEKHYGDMARSLGFRIVR